MEYGCIAEKLSHSFSKDIHSQLFDYEYELREIPRAELDSFMCEKSFKAVNVTIPYKQAVIPYIGILSENAREIGAVNTIVNRNGILYGYNTDLAGMISLIDKEGILIKDRKVLILGSGGTSKTAFAVAKKLEAKSIFRVSRTAGEDRITYEDAVTNHSDAEIIINTTPVGMYPNIGQSPIDISAFKRLEGVVDAVYNPLRSKLVCDALKLNIKAVGGLYMLVAQAAFAAEKFVDTAVPKGEIDRVYRNMLTKKQNIVLVGMPGCGKTTVGKLLAERLGFTFTDTDEEITKREGKTPAEIISRYGEASFREIEAAVIFEISGQQSSVIATGGGAVLNSKNTDMLRENGRIYFLDRPLDRLEITSNRPLSSDREALKARYNERYHIYCSCCDVRITSTDSVSLAAETIEKDFLK